MSPALSPASMLALRGVMPQGVALVEAYASHDAGDCVHTLKIAGGVDLRPEPL